jgi:hypothetical protein
MNCSYVQTLALVAARATVVAGAIIVETVGAVTSPYVESLNSIALTVKGCVTASPQISATRSTLAILEFSAISAIVDPFETRV